MRIFLTALFIAVLGVSGMPQKSDPDLRVVVEKRFHDKMHADFANVCPITDDWVAARVFTEYGAIFVAEDGVRLPSKCIYENDATLSAQQQLLDPVTENIGGTSVTLQRPAMAALQKARDAAAKQGIAITPRGGSAASMRSYSKTVELWQSRFEPALAFWTKKGKITAAEANAARRAPIREQISKVLIWEGQSLWFSKDLQKSILYSVAAPGASQHNFMLALDVDQYSDKRVRDIMAKFGWFQTVKSDLPHFTYLGVPESRLKSLGLKDVTVDGQKFWIPRLD